MKRYYPKEDIKEKTKMLTEYYKFHSDIPRLFMYPVTKTLNRYHDKKRRIEYEKITKLIAEEERKDSGSNKKNDKYHNHNLK